MHAFRLQDQETAGLVGLGARVLMLAAEADLALDRHIAGFGGRIDREAELYSALSSVIDDPAGWDIFMMICDGYGGLDHGFRAHRMLGAVAERMPTILVSSGCARQIFPEDRTTPIQLRGPVSAVSLRVGMEHALRGKLAWHMN